MKQLFRFAALALLPAALASSTAAQAAGPCLTMPEAQAVTLVALPAIIRSAGIACAALPPNAVIRQDSGPFIDRYTAAADHAWPAAQAALIRLGSPAIAPLVQSQAARPLLAGLLAPLIVGEINPVSCPAIDHMAGLLAPLPPENVAGLIVSGVMLARDAKERHGEHDKTLSQLPLCAGEPR